MEALSHGPAAPPLGWYECEVTSASILAMRRRCPGGSVCWVLKHGTCVAAPRPLHLRRCGLRCLWGCQPRQSRTVNCVAQPVLSGGEAHRMYARATRKRTVVCSGRQKAASTAEAKRARVPPNRLKNPSSDSIIVVNATDRCARSYSTHLPPVILLPCPPAVFRNQSTWPRGGRPTGFSIR
jgi:hypothetical protein